MYLASPLIASPLQDKHMEQQHQCRQQHTLTLINRVLRFGFLFSACRIFRYKSSSHYESIEQETQVPLLQGENICCSCQDITFVCPFTSPEPASVRGTLNITNYRLYFFSHNINKEQPVLLDLPLGFVSRVEKVSGARNLGDTYGLEVVCKDIRTLRFVLTEPEEGGHPRRQIFEALVTNAFPLSYASQLFAFKFKEQCGGNGNDGWKVYDQTEELKRMGLPNENWLISDVNQEYQLCDTYPTILGLPARTTLEDLQEVAKFRSRGRIPVLSWIHPESQVTITR